MEKEEEKMFIHTSTVAQLRNLSKQCFEGSGIKISNGFGIKDQNLGNKRGSVMKKYTSLRFMTLWLTLMILDGI